MKVVIDWLRARDLRFLAILAIVTTIVYGFVELGEAVGSMETADFDRAILLGLRDDDLGRDPIGPHWLERTIVNLSALGSVAVLTLLVIGIAGFLLLDGKPRQALLLIGCAIGTAVAMSLLKPAFGRERPDFVLHIDPAGGLSFPSGHSMAAAAIYLTLGELIARGLDKRRLRIFVVAVAATIVLIVGFSRCYIGVHYPSDVLGGWAVGFAWALVLGVLARRLQQKGVVEKTAEGQPAAT